MVCHRKLWYTQQAYNMKNNFIPIVIIAICASEIGEALSIWISICQICFLQKKTYRGFHQRLRWKFFSWPYYWVDPAFSFWFLDVLHTHVRTTSFTKPCWECWVTTEEWEEWVLFHTWFGNLLWDRSICH